MMLLLLLLLLHVLLVLHPLLLLVRVQVRSCAGAMTTGRPP